MPELRRNGISYSSGGSSSANGITFDNTDTNLESTNVQDAISELNNSLNNAFVAPDYAAIIGNEEEYTYTQINAEHIMPSDGYIIGNSRHDAAHLMYISINGFPVVYQRVEGDVVTGTTTSIFPVKKGDTVIFHNGGTSVYEVWVKFFPLRR